MKTTQITSQIEVINGPIINCISSELSLHPAVQHHSNEIITWSSQLSVEMAVLGFRKTLQLLKPCIKNATMGRQLRFQSPETYQ